MIGLSAHFTESHRLEEDTVWAGDVSAAQSQDDGWVEISGADARPSHSASNVNDGKTLNLVPGRIALFASG